MSTKTFNLGLMFFWIALCVGLLTREWWMTPDLLERVTGPNTPKVIAVAGMLAVWNLMRFWMAKQRSKPVGISPEAEQYRRRIRSSMDEDPRITNPEFQFDDPYPDGTLREK